MGEYVVSSKKETNVHCFQIPESFAEFNVTNGFSGSLEEGCDDAIGCR